MWRKGNPRALLMGLQIVVDTVENSMGFPQKKKKERKKRNRTTIFPSNSTSAYLAEGIQNTNSKRPKHPYVCGSTGYSSSDSEGT